MLDYFFVDWYRHFGREFPWRREGLSPYVVLVTEILLRQTRAENVARVWPAFISKYPDCASLLRAKQAELLSHIHVLGFGNQRAMALTTVARWLYEHHGGAVPATEGELLAIPHVGLYTARAVLCFAYGVPLAIVDTNILRLFSRYFALDLRRYDNRRAPTVWKLAESITPKESQRAREHNYGLLDFTATVCTPRSPRCVTCPLAASCAYPKSRVT